MKKKIVLAVVVAAVVLAGAFALHRPQFLVLMRN